RATVGSVMPPETWFRGPSGTRTPIFRPQPTSRVGVLPRPGAGAPRPLVEFRYFVADSPVREGPVEVTHQFVPAAGRTGPPQPAPGGCGSGRGCPATPGTFGSGAVTDQGHTGWERHPGDRPTVLLATSQS